MGVVACEQLHSHQGTLDTGACAHLHTHVGTWAHTRYVNTLTFSHLGSTDAHCVLVPVPGAGIEQGTSRRKIPPLAREAWVAPLVK